MSATFPPTTRIRDRVLRRGGRNSGCLDRGRDGSCAGDPSETLDFSFEYLVGSREQERQQRALSRGPQRRRRSVHESGQRPEDPELEGHRPTPTRVGGGRPWPPTAGQRRPPMSSYANPVAAAYTAWWKASMAISSLAQKTTGGAMSRAGSVTCAAP